jgi:hypothetical protein
MTVAIQSHLTSDLLAVLKEVPVVERLSRFLGISDLLNLRLVSSSINRALKEIAIWDALLDVWFPTNIYRLIQEYCHYFASLGTKNAQLVNHVLLKCNPLHHFKLYHKLSHFNGDHEHEPQNGTSTKDSFVSGFSQLSLDGELDLDQEKQDICNDAFHKMASFEKTGSLPEFECAIGLALTVLAEHPFHPGLLHILAFSMSILGNYPLALQILEFGIDLDPSFSEMQGKEFMLSYGIPYYGTLMLQLHSILNLPELRLSIQKAMDELPASNGLLQTAHPPQLVHDISSHLQGVFDERDSDCDGAWTHEELQSFIEFLNGSRPDLKFCMQFAQMFGCSDNGYLTKEGLIDFFTHQSANEPEETVQDLSKLGFSIKSESI